MLQFIHCFWFFFFFVFPFSFLNLLDNIPKTCQGIGSQILQSGPGGFHIILGLGLTILWENDGAACAQYILHVECCEHLSDSPSTLRTVF